MSRRDHHHDHNVRRQTDIETARCCWYRKCLAVITIMTITGAVILLDIETARCYRYRKCLAVITIVINMSTVRQLDTERQLGAIHIESVSP